MSEWETVPLTDVLQYREGPGVGAKDFHAEGIPLIRLAGLKTGSALLDGCNFLDPDQVKAKWDHFRLQLGDVLLSTSASLGEVARVDGSGVGAVPYTGIIGFRPADHRILASFIPFLLTAPTFQQQIQEMGVGSVMKHFGPSHLQKMFVSFPPTAMQAAIADVLGAIDEKIAANTKLSGTADDYVRSTFDGITPVSAVQISDLFTLRREPVEPIDLSAATTYVGLEHIPRRKMWMGSAGSASEVTSGKSQFIKGDVLFGKLRPYFHKVAAAKMSGICSTDVLVLEPSNVGLEGLSLAAVASDSVVEAVVSMSEGTRMPRTSWKDLASVEVPWPTDEVAIELSAQIASVRDAVHAVLEENETLLEIRATLLPLLMSNKLRVKDAEKVLEAAGI